MEAPRAAGHSERMNSRSLEIFIHGLFVVFIITVLYYGLRPGRLVLDTSGCFYSGIIGEYNDTYPVAVQGLLGLFAVSMDSLATFFMFHLVFYWFGFYLLSLSFLVREKYIFSYLILMAGLFPYNISMTHWLVKDFWILSAALCNFGLFYLWYTLKKYDPVLFTFNIVLALLTLMLRHNLATLAPALAVPIVVMVFNVLNLKRTLIRMTIVLIAVSGLLYTIGSSIHYSLLSVPPDSKLVKLQVYDLIGISILNNHTGVTKDLNEKDKMALTKMLYETNLFWGMSNTVKELRRQLRRSTDINQMWKTTVLTNLWDYCKLKWHAFAFCFNDSKNYGYLMIKPGQSGYGRFHDRLAKEFEIDPVRDTFVLKMYTKYIEKYLSIVPSSFWIYLLSWGLVLLSGYMVIFKKIFDDDLLFSLLLNIFSHSYTGVYLFILSAGTSEQRYVYPANVITIISVVFFVSYVYNYQLVSLKNKHLTSKD